MPMDTTEEIQVENSFPVTSRKTENGTLFSIYILKGIDAAEQFIPAIEALTEATENDVVLVHLSTAGGCVDATDTFLFALSTTSARVVFAATGGVHSAGTMMLMHADEISLSPGFNALVHNGSLGSAGKFSDWQAAADFSTKFMHRLFHNTYEGFLSPEEIAALIAGKDFWFDRDEFMLRWCKRMGVEFLQVE